MCQVNSSVAQELEPNKRQDKALHDQAQLSADKALQTLIRLADRGIRPHNPRNFPPRQTKGKDDKWRRHIVPPELKLTQWERLLMKYPGDISRVDRTSGRLHCRCGMYWKTSLANLEQMYALHVNGKVCAHRRRGMQTHTLFHCWGGVIPGKPPPPPKIPDPNALCRGLWEDKINGMNLTTLYNRNTTNRIYYAIPSYAFNVKDKDGEETTIMGTIRSVACTGYCVGVDGYPRPQWRCLECDALKTSAAIINGLVHVTANVCVLVIATI